MPFIPLNPAFPTEQHANAAGAAADVFANDPAVEAVLLMGSCARGKAAVTSCVDLLVLLRPETLARERSRLEQVWQAHYPEDAVYQDMLRLAKFTHIDIDFIDGVFDPARFDHGWTTGADVFELEVGNTLAYTVPLIENGGYYRELREQWLLYYPEELRAERLAMALKYCRNNLEHIPYFAPRELYFQSFKRLYHAFEEFLQALFIAHRTYPIAYDKWVKEEVVDILGLPDLYDSLAHVLAISEFESQEVVEKTMLLNRLIDSYILPLR